MSKLYKNQPAGIFIALPRSHNLYQIEQSLRQLLQAVNVYDATVSTTLSVNREECSHCGAIWKAGVCSVGNLCCQDDRLELEIDVERRERERPRDLVDHVVAGKAGVHA